MKKIILSVLLILAINTINYSQIILKDLDGIDISGQTFSPSTDFLNPTYFKVQNTGNSEITVIIEVTELTPATNGGDNYAITFCWGGCFPPIIKTGILNTIPAEAHTIPANSFSSEQADIYIVEDGATEQSLITFKFYEQGNESNNAIITFDTEFSAIDESGLSNNLAAYPNPASSNVTFSYNVENYNNANITIYNVLGKEIKKLNIDNKTGKKSINTSDFSSGVYFYNLSVDGKIITTKKLIISK
jgi:hypothetical protein